MKEIEAKILEINPKSVRRQMDDLNAEKEFKTEISSEFYDFPSGEIEEDGSLRLREIKDEHIILTRKKDVKDDTAKVKEEIEIEVGNMDGARELLLSLGLEEVKSNEKTRAKWQRNGIEYVIDWYPNIPPLLEIEAPTHNELKSAFEELGYSLEESVDWGSGKVHSNYEKLD